jgi:hypothetical protein
MPLNQLQFSNGTATSSGGTHQRARRSTSA